MSENKGVIERCGICGLGFYKGEASRDDAQLGPCHYGCFGDSTLRLHARLHAQAVLAASGQEIGQAETQAPSTTSHQTGEE